LPRAEPRKRGSTSGTPAPNETRHAANGCELGMNEAAPKLGRNHGNPEGRSKAGNPATTQALTIKLSGQSAARQRPDWRPMISGIVAYSNLSLDF
ncbi:MAG: hypothetical protein ACRERU_08170, partial [Methylococcales bacterium]